MVVRRTLQVFTATGAIRAWATVLMVILGFGLALGLTIGYVAKKSRDDDRRWCSLLVNLDDAYQQNPPTSPVGRQIAADMHNLRVGFGC
jgi:hypothetical protein